MIETFAKPFELTGVGALKPGEDFGCEAGDFAVNDFFIFREGIAHAEFAMADETDDIAGVGDIHRLTIATEKFMGTGETNLLAGLGVKDGHVALEFAGADANEGEAIAMTRIHIRLNLEDESGKTRIGRFDRDAIGGASARGGGVFEETIEEELNAEIIHGAAEKDGGEFAGFDRFAGEGGAGVLEHFMFLEDFLVGAFGHAFADGGVLDSVDRDGGFIGAAGNALEEMDLVAGAIENAFEIGAGAEGPIHGEGFDAEDALEFIEQFKRIARGAIHLVHEGEDGDAAATADLEELAGLSFDPFAGIDDHDNRIDGGEDAIGVLGEILVAGGVEKINPVAAVFELEDGRTDRDAALALEFHPVGSGRALGFAGGDGAGELDRAAVEEKLLGESGFPCVRMRNNRKGAPARDFFCQVFAQRKAV